MLWSLHARAGAAHKNTFSRHSLVPQIARTIGEESKNELLSRKGVSGGAE